MDLKSGYPFSLIRYGMPYQYPKLLSNIKTDLVIVGGGISGALIAYHLMNAGIDCIVVDGRSIGLGSTCASTSLLQYELDVSFTELSKKIGHKDAARAYHLCNQSIHKLGSIAEKIDFTEFAPNKSLYFAAYKKHRAFIKEEFEARQAIGLPVDLLDDRQLKMQFGLRGPAAILSHNGAYADAYLFTHALHQFGIKKGLQVYERTYIRKVSNDDTYVKLTTADNISIKTKNVIYATGYEVDEFVRKKIVKLHSTYVTISEPIPEKFHVMDKAVMLWNTATPYLYMRKTKDRRMIVGGRDEKYFNPVKRDKLINKKSKLLVNDFNRIFPAVIFKPEFSWTGTFGSTIDGLPFIGRHPKYDNRYFALGYGGNGITFSLLAAEIIRDLILEKSNKDARLFSFARV